MSTDIIYSLLSDIPDCHVEKDAPVAPHTSFRIGGTASAIASPRTKEALAAAIRAMRMHGVKYCVLGNGSNVLFCSDRYSGAVILTGGLCSISRSGSSLICGCGAMLTAAANYACAEALSGLEFAYGIPGSVGGATYMNAGAYGGQMSDIAESSLVYDAGKDQFLTFDASAHRYSYRNSVFCSRPELTVLETVLRLTEGSPAEIRDKMNGFMERRRAKQPLSYPSAGSVFKRGENYYASELIDKCGLKGTSIGGAQVSTLHAGFIINTGGATGNDVLRLTELIRARVLEKFGVELECEIRLLS